jgi:hypothetical protein
MTADKYKNNSFLCHFEAKFFGTLFIAEYDSDQVWAVLEVSTDKKLFHLLVACIKYQ